VGKYDSIAGEVVELRIGNGVDKVVQDIMSAVQDSQVQRRDEIVAICKEVLEEKDRGKKLAKITTLISTAAGIAEIAQFAMQLQGFLP